MSDEIEIKLQRIILRLDMLDERIKRQDRMREILDQLKNKDGASSHLDHFEKLCLQTFMDNLRRPSIYRDLRRILLSLLWRTRLLSILSTAHQEAIHRSVNSAIRPTLYADFRRIVLFIARRLKFLPRRNT